MSSSVLKFLQSVADAHVPFGGLPYEFLPEGAKPSFQRGSTQRVRVLYSPSNSYEVEPDTLGCVIVSETCLEFRFTLSNMTFRDLQRKMSGLEEHVLKTMGDDPSVYHRVRKTWGRLTLWHRHWDVALNGADIYMFRTWVAAVRVLK